MKSHFNYSPLMLVLISLWGCSQAVPEASKPIAEQKVAIDLNKNGQLEPYENSALPLDERLTDLLSRLTPAEKVQLRQQPPAAVSVERTSAVSPVASNRRLYRRWTFPNHC